MIAVAAIGSVGETTAPSTNAAAHGSPGTIACATTATTTIVRRTRPTASSPTGRRFERRSRSEVKNAAP